MMKSLAGYRMSQCAEQRRGRKKHRATTTQKIKKNALIEIRLIEVVRIQARVVSVDREIDKEVDKRIPK